MTPISVTIPVGPFPANKRWLQECLDSVANQTIHPSSIILVNDGANLDLDIDIVPETLEKLEHVKWVIYDCPWRTGISHSFNYGVMLAPTDLVFMLGSDDTLEPTCLEKCIEAFEKNDSRLECYYSVPIRYMDTGEFQDTPCNAAMVSKQFWHLTGGFPIETAIGAGDAALLSILMKHDQTHPLWVDKYTQWVGNLTNDLTTPLYNYRRHPGTHTAKLTPYWTVINEIRNILTESWSKEDISKWSGGYN